jgi:micrococcal nuclease
MSSASYQNAGSLGIVIVHTVPNRTDVNIERPVSMHLPKRHVFTLGLVGLSFAVMSPFIAMAGDPTPNGDEQNPMYHGALPWELPDDAEEMVVHSVTDGDTVRLTYPNDDWYYNTRIIGIQAPEMDGPWTDEECYGPEAKEFLIELLPVGTSVWVQQDISDEDDNGRRLRHIFIVEDNGDAYLVSEILVLGGYAVARSYPPDDLYDDILAEAQDIARDDDEGLWDTCSRKQ